MAKSIGVLLAINYELATNIVVANDT